LSADRQEELKRKEERGRSIFGKRPRPSYKFFLRLLVDVTGAVALAGAMTGLHDLAIAVGILPDQIVTPGLTRLLAHAGLVAHPALVACTLLGLLIALRLVAVLSALLLLVTHGVTSPYLATATRRQPDNSARDDMVPPGHRG